MNSSLYERAKNLLINVIGTGNILNFISNFSLFRATFVLFSEQLFEILRAQSGHA